MNTTLPEKYRLARNLDKGYEIRTEDGQWIEITWHLHITAPLNFVTINLADGTKANFAPDVRLMSRRLGGDR